MERPHSTTVRRGASNPGGSAARSARGDEVVGSRWRGAEPRDLEEVEPPQAFGGDLGGRRAGRLLRPGTRPARASRGQREGTFGRLGASWPRRRQPGMIAPHERTRGQRRRTSADLPLLRRHRSPCRDVERPRLGFRLRQPRLRCLRRVGRGVLTPRIVSQDQTDLSERTPAEARRPSAITFSERTEPPGGWRARPPPKRVERHVGAPRPVRLLDGRCSAGNQRRRLL